MKFFVPGTKDEAQAEHIWAATKKFAEESWSVTDRKIFRISYLDYGHIVAAEVGRPDPLIGETVLVILESDEIFLVCTANRGVVRSIDGGPILVGRKETREVIDFE